MYADHAELEGPEDAEALALAANKYQIFGLLEFCTAFLQTVVTPSNVWRILALTEALMETHQTLIDACVQVNIYNYQEIAQSC